MDTNVFMARFKPDDPFHDEASAIIKMVEKGVVQVETSSFTLLEVASVSGRLYLNRKAGDEKGKRVFVIKMLKRLQRLKTRFIHIAGDRNISMKGIDAMMPSLVDESIMLSLQCNLKTLDIIHLAAARRARSANQDLEALVTGDVGFLSDRMNLSKIVGMPVLSPKEYLEGLDNTSAKHLSLEDSE
jgi:predicted nucleic acid-binding protein